MCCFLAFGVENGGLDEIKALCPRSLHVDPCANRSVTRGFGVAVNAYWLTTGGCSCRLAPPPPNEEARARVRPPREIRLRRKYQARGWTRAKIDRAVADSVAASGYAAPPAGFRQDVAVFLTELAERFGRIQLVLHWFDGPLDVELPLRRGRKIPVVSLASEPVEYDRCHEIIAGAGLTTS